MAKVPSGIFRPWYTEAGPDGKRHKRVSHQWAYRFEMHGRTYQKAGFATASAATEARDQRRTEVRAGQEQDWRKLTLQGIQQMAAARKVQMSGSSRRNFDASWARLYRFFKPEDLVAEIDDTRILEFVGFSQKQGRYQNTIRLDLAHLGRAMRIANSKRLLPFVPEFPTVRYQPRDHTIQPFQLEQILEHMPGYWRLFFEAAQELGWRAHSEIRTRKWTHVDWGPDIWTCCGPVTADVCSCGAGRPGWLELEAEATKTRARRVYPMTRRLRSILQAARQRWEQVAITARGINVAAIDQWIFVRDDGQQLGSAKDSWASALRKLGVKPIRPEGGGWSSAMVPHDLRRTAIRRMRREGIDKETRKDLVGHATDAVHEAYLGNDLDLEAMRSAAVKLDRERAGPTENASQLLLFRRC